MFGYLFRYTLDMISTIVSVPYFLNGVPMCIFIPKDIA